MVTTKANIEKKSDGGFSGSSCISSAGCRWHPLAHCANSKAEFAQSSSLCVDYVQWCKYLHGVLFNVQKVWCKTVVGHCTVHCALYNANAQCAKVFQSVQKMTHSCQLVVHSDEASAGGQNSCEASCITVTAWSSFNKNYKNLLLCMLHHRHCLIIF